LLEIAAPHFKSSTLAMFLKGRDVAAEIDEAAQDWRFDYVLEPSVTDEDARVVLLKALKPKREG
jgi:16S rRNA (guanine527-N7)-methyltransferase